jgi:fused signal recognition particle receptor
MLCRFRYQPREIIEPGAQRCSGQTGSGRCAAAHRQVVDVIRDFSGRFFIGYCDCVVGISSGLDIPVVKQAQGSDSASVIFDALQSAQARNIDILIADTAGRLHTQNNLMDELEKIKRVMSKLDPDAPHETILVLDAVTGQNALTQASSFKDAIGVSGVILTKLDGTAKGGMIFSVAEQLKLPIRYIGVGESVEDLRPFNSHEFVDALLSEPDT